MQYFSPLPVIAFDTPEAFTTQGGAKPVVYLTASRVPDAWAAFVDRVRMKLTGAGYQLGPYKMHVTLARVPAGSIDLNTLRARICTVDVPKISSTLSMADYRFFREFHWKVREWKL